jgi:hypothetical protein
MFCPSANQRLVPETAFQSIYLTTLYQMIDSIVMDEWVTVNDELLNMLMNAISAYGYCTGVLISP